MSIRNYIVRFDDLTLRCDVRGDHYQTISRFCSDLRADIQRAMLTSSYHVDSVEDAFHLALELALFFKRISIFKVREQYSKCEGYGHDDTCASRRVNMLILCLVMMLTT